MIKTHLTKQDEPMELLYPSRHSGNHEGGSRIQSGVMERVHPTAEAGINSFIPRFSVQVSNNSTGTRMTPS